MIGRRQGTTLRDVIALVVGVAVFSAVTLCIIWIKSALGIPQQYDNDISWAFQTWPIGLLAIVIACWVACAVREGKWDGDFSARDKLAFYATSMCLAIVVIFSSILELAFNNFDAEFIMFIIIQYIIQLCTMAGVGWACKQWYNKRVAQYKTTEQ